MKIIKITIKLNFNPISIKDFLFNNFIKHLIIRRSYCGYLEFIYLQRELNKYSDFPCSFKEFGKSNVYFIKQNFIFYLGFQFKVLETNYLNKYWYNYI